jgi:predicted dehydrogenase
MLGCGGFASLCHGPAQAHYRQGHPGISLTACCDPDAMRANAFRERFGYARAYTDPRQMLAAEKPDAVVVAVPPAATCEAALPVIDYGCSLLIEKPPGLTLAELHRLVSAAETSGARALVAFNRRTMPVMGQASRILLRDFPPEAVDFIDYEMIRSNRWNEDFSTTAIHGVDALLFLARAPYQSVALGYQAQRDHDRLAVNVLLEARSSAGSRLKLTILPAAGRDLESIRIHGANRSLLISLPTSPRSAETGSLEFWQGGALIESYSDRECSMVERMGIVGELDALLGGAPPARIATPTLTACVQQVAIMEAIRLGRPTQAFSNSP